MNKKVGDIAESGLPHAEVADPAAPLDAEDKIQAILQHLEATATTSGPLQ